MSLPNNPITRKETYLAKIAGQNVTIPDEPITREEMYLDAIAKGGGSGDGDMKKSVYDSDLSVAGAGGIASYVQSAMTDVVEKSATPGLLKNDGTVDETSYATASSVSTINGKIPEGASSLNPLATQDEIEDIWENNARTGVHNLYDRSKVIAPSGALFENTATGQRVYLDTAGTYKATRLNFSNLGFKVGERYILSADVTITSGYAAMTIRQSSGTTRQGTGSIETGTHATLEFTVVDTTDYISLFCTSGTSEVGDVTYNNLLLKRAEDTSDEYADFAMTNLELTNIAPTCDLICTADNYKAVNDEIALSADVSKYNQLIFMFARNNSNDGFQMFPVVAKEVANSTYFLFRFRYNTDSRNIQVQYKSEGNKFVVTASDLLSDEYGLRKIYGIR